MLLFFLSSRPQYLFVFFNRVATLARAPKLYNLDLRENETKQGVIGKGIVEGLHSPSSNLFCIKLDEIDGAAFFGALSNNDTLGILVCRTPLWRWNLHLNEEELMGDNTTFYSLDPLPPDQGRFQNLRKRLRRNQTISIRVRIVVVMLLVSRLYHREESGIFSCLPKDLMIYLCKWVWRTRKDRSWFVDPIT